MRLGLTFTQVAWTSWRDKVKTWDRALEVQKAIDLVRPFEEQLGVINEAMNQMGKIAAQDLLASFTRATDLAAKISDLLPTSEILAGAVQPLPDLRFTVPMNDIVGNLNRAIENALFLAELDFSVDDVDERAPQEELVEQAEEQLIEVVPEEVLDNLNRVDFAPFSLLDEVLRNSQAMHKLSSRDFEGFIATLVERLGFEDVVLTPRSGDKGRDVLATKRVHGISILCAFECKRYAPDRPVGPEIMRALLGTILHGATRAAKGILVTTSTFTSGARKYIVTEPSLDGRDFDGIVDWLHEYGSSSLRGVT